jgi:hypothetical protein
MQDSRYGHSLKELEAQKSAFLAELAQWPAHAMDRRPDPTNWSAVEVVDHLVKTEVEILHAAREGLKRPRPIRSVDKVRTRFLQSIFASDRRVKVPAKATVVLPGSDLQFTELVQRWGESRVELDRFLRENNGDALSSGIFHHPVGGRMGMEQIMNFFAVHVAHHRFQVMRIKSAVLPGVL